MTPLKLDPQGLPNGLADVQRGDAVVAFNRRAIYNARRVGGIYRPWHLLLGCCSRVGNMVFLTSSLAAVVSSMSV
jgi:hypothetical protein